MATRKTLKRVVFDIETYPFSEACEWAQAQGNKEEWFRNLPQMRVACAYDGRRWRYFLPSEAPNLVKLLVEADEVISFNGLSFDEQVLRRHYGLTGPCPATGKHLDLLHEIFSQYGVRPSLDALAQLNLGEPKRVHGRDMANLDLEALKEACRSDVAQTYRLWRLREQGALEQPFWVLKGPSSEKREFDDVGPGHHMPTICSHCGKAGTLEMIEDDPGEMTESHASDYEAGISGTAICTSCGHEADW